MPFPKPSEIHPVVLPDGSRHCGTVFLSAVLEHPRIDVGDNTYMSSHDALSDPADIAFRLAPYLYDFSPERLIIGRFCQIAHGVQCITASANHRHDGLSTFPFMIFSPSDSPEPGPSMPEPGPDTVIGNDVWIGTGAMILPGAAIGDGVIVGAGAVVGGVVPPYSVVTGNPARVVRARLKPEDAGRMRAVAWWDWPIDVIVAHEAQICGTDIAALERVALEIKRSGG